MTPYCASRHHTRRRPTRTVQVGSVAIGSAHPLALQSMTTTDTEDIAATTAQTRRLAEAGAHLVRITAPSRKAARALGLIRARLNEDGFGSLPLVADIHFLPSAAMEALEHVEKVRINPGNYADHKRFKNHAYTDAEYASELQRLHDALTPLFLRAKALGRALRIGTNHGSLSDRILNRYGDTPRGMVESALEFLRIARAHGLRDLIVSMKASNPKVMIQAYRLAATLMDAEGFDLPLHLGVTEAGDGEDARIKSAIGIQTLLYDGLGDTLRVSLTEDPVHEIPVARKLAQRAEALWQPTPHAPDLPPDALDPYAYTRRPTSPLPLHPTLKAGGQEPPRVVLPVPQGELPAIVRAINATHLAHREARIEGLLLPLTHRDALASYLALRPVLAPTIAAWILEIAPSLTPDDLADTPAWIAAPRFDHLDPDTLVQRLEAWIAYARRHTTPLVLDASWTPLPLLREAAHRVPVIATLSQARIALTPVPAAGSVHPVGLWRLLAQHLGDADLPLWIRATPAMTLLPEALLLDPEAPTLEYATLAGALLCDGLGDLLSIEGLPDLTQATALAYNILQGARTRVSKTEYVACPSCGRTLFDLESTTRAIRARTAHLKGVTIAIMGCIVNGPGEMADADFGYVGGAPGKVNLYVGKTAVRHGIPESEAVEQLIALIREHGKWSDAPT